MLLLHNYKCECEYEYVYMYLCKGLDGEEGKR